MSLKSVVDIVVNDAEFQRFQALFNNYKAGLAATPAAWTAANTAAAATTGAIAAGAQGLQHHVVLINQAAGASKAAAAHTVSQAGAWQRMARDSRAFAGHIVDATRSLLRWGEITGLISGILGGGGLFGIDRLAINAGERRKSALGLGVKPGEESSFDVNLSRIMDPRAFLEHINRGKTFISSDERRGMGALGINPGAKDTAETAIDTLRSLKKLVDSIPESGMGAFGEIMHARGADALMPVEQLQTLRSTKGPEFEKYLSDTVEGFKRFNLPDAAAKVWQDLQVQFKDAGTKITTEFQKALVPLAPAITLLSTNFTNLATDLMNNPHLRDWINGLANSIKEFGDWIGTDKFKEDVTGFVAYVSNLATHAGNFTTGVRDMAGAIQDFMVTVRPILDWLKATKVPDEYNPQNLANQAGEWLRKKLLTGDADTLTGGALGGSSTGPGGASGAASPLIEEFKQWLHDRPKGGGYSDPSGEFGPPTASPSSFRQLEGQQGLPPGLLGVVYKTESNNNPNAISPAGAKGGFQFMDATARDYGVSNPFDLNQSASGASRYFKDLLTEFHGDIAKAAAGYNWGQGNVEKDIRQYGDRWREHLPGETKDYVSKIERGLGGAAANGMKRTTVDINVNNATGANITSSVAQLAV
jgi:hypothetical protein